MDNNGGLVTSRQNQRSNAVLLLDQSKKFLKERQATVAKVRVVADLMKSNVKDHQETRNKVGTTGMGASIISYIGFMILTVIPAGNLFVVPAMMAGLFSTGTIIGMVSSDVSNSKMQENSIKALCQCLKEDVAHIKNLLNLKDQLVMRPTLKKTIQNLTEERWKLLGTELIIKLPKILVLLESGHNDKIKNILNNELNPDIQFIIGLLPLDLSPECRQELVLIHTRIGKDIVDTGKAIYDLLVYLVQSNAIFTDGGFVADAWCTPAVTASWGNWNTYINWLKSFGAAPALQLAIKISAFGSTVLGTYDVLREYNAKGDTAGGNSAGFIKLCKIADALEAEERGVEAEIAKLERELRS